MVTSKHVKDGVKKGAWSSEEDELLTRCVKLHGQSKWRSLAQKAGLNRSGKSCRLRWLNYLRPGIKKGAFSPDEDELIIKLHRLLGNRNGRWALIAGRLPGRTDNGIKNYWNAILFKKLKVQGFQAEDKKGLQQIPGQCSSPSMQTDHDEDQDDKSLISSSMSSILTSLLILWKRVLMEKMITKAMGSCLKMRANWTACNIWSSRR